MSAKQSSVSTTKGLRERRRKKRRSVLVVFLILLLLLLAAAIYLLHQPAMRISKVQIFGGDPALERVVLETLQGSYMGIIPTDVAFFYPKARVRERILESNPDIAAVSQFRTGLNGLSVRVDYRVPIATWCGLSPTPGAEEYCYVFDGSGVIYAPADTLSSTTEVMNTLTLYAPLMGGREEPLNSTLEDAERLPRVFDVARQLLGHGAKVSQVHIHDGEVDALLHNGTRVTYLLGTEESSYAALMSVLSNKNVLDGTYEYVDLRFGNKVYLKKKGEEVTVE